jgi:dienelactone hydrolase
VQFLRGTANAIGIRNDHIAVEGFSAGARLAAEAFTTGDDPYFAGVELWPLISDQVNALIGFYHPLDGSMQYQDQYYGGDDSSPNAAVQQRWDLADSLSHADRAKGPALFLTGSEDWDLQIIQMAQFTQAMQAAGQEAGYLVVPGGGHGFDEGDGYRLSKLGEGSATAVLVFLNHSFPQVPERVPQANSPDVINAPDFTGAPPSTFVPRPRATASATFPPNYSTLPKSSVPKRAPVVPPTNTIPPVTKPSTSVTIAPSSPPSITSPPSSSTPPTTP